jgi:hypothetical protein
MLTKAMGLETRPDKYMHAIGVLALWQRSGLRSRAPSRLCPGIWPYQEQQN